jgi:4-hydroxy-tetrahydrodipicolinate synthase
MCLPAYASEFYKLSERERLRAVAEAVQYSTGRIPVFAQINFVSAAQSVESALEAQRSGASAIAVAVPRIFTFGESDFYRYFDRILSAVEIPLLIQDFRWVKLEEPMMSPKVAAILDVTHGEVGVLEGWGGMYMLDLIPAGICGVMPGVAVADVLAVVFQCAVGGDVARAFDIFQRVLPQIAFSLQHMELFHHAEKRLLTARGVLPGAIVRQLALGLDKYLEDRILFLNDQILMLLDHLGLPRNPSVDTQSENSYNTRVAKEL